LPFNFDHDSTMLEHDYRKLLRCTLIAVALCIAAVLVCYFWIDRPVAFFVYHHQINKVQVFRWLTYPPPELQTWSPLVLTVLMVRRAWGPFVRWQKILLVACLSLIVADEFRTSLGMFVVAIGRRPGPTTTNRSLATVSTVSIRFSVATTSAAFRPATPPGSWASPRCG
jgi:hypothetical protein